MPAVPKPEPRKRMKARAKRTEAAIIRAVRAACVARDGYCRASDLGGCYGPSEWAHAPWWTRAKTRGMKPELRHTTAGSMMLCQKHHADVDGHRLMAAPGDERWCDSLVYFVVSL